MTKFDTSEIENFPEEYKEMMKGLLNKRQLELLTRPSQFILTTLNP